LLSFEKEANKKQERRKKRI